MPQYEAHRFGLFLKKNIYLEKNTSPPNHSVFNYGPKEITVTIILIHRTKPVVLTFN